MFSGSRPAGRRACAVRRRKSACGRLVCHPDRTRHAGTRWVTERITSRKGGLDPETTTEMTGTNDSVDAARNGPERQRQLLRKERLADGKLFSLLTAHANGRPLPFLSPICPNVIVKYYISANERGLAVQFRNTGSDYQRIIHANNRIIHFMI